MSAASPEGTSDSTPVIHLRDKWFPSTARLRAVPFGHSAAYGPMKDAVRDFGPLRREGKICDAH